MVESGYYIPDGPPQPAVQSDKKAGPSNHRNAVMNKGGMRTRIRKRNQIHQKISAAVIEQGERTKKKRPQVQLDEDGVLISTEVSEVSLHFDEEDENDDSEKDEKLMSTHSEKAATPREAADKMGTPRSLRKDGEIRRPPPLSISDSFTTDSDSLLGKSGNPRLNALFAELNKLKAETEHLRETNQFLERDKKIECARLNLQVGSYINFYIFFILIHAVDGRARASSQIL